MPSIRVSDCRASRATRNEGWPDPCEVKFIWAQGKENQMFCAECGAAISDNAVVCPKCGVAVAGRKVAIASNTQVPNHMVGAILSTVFCCLIGGIIAIVYASQVNTKLAQGDIAGAQAASKAANGWIIANVIVGLLGGLFYFILAVAGAAL